MAVLQIFFVPGCLGARRLQEQLFTSFPDLACEWIDLETQRPLARQLGIIASPTMVAGARRLMGVPSADSLRRWLEEEPLCPPNSGT